jgi:hypothetical protein
VVLLLIAGLRRVDRRKGVALAMLGAVLIAYPMYFLTVSRSLVGENFQARYLLPILPVFIAVALLATKSGKPTFVARPFLVLMGAALSVAHSFALHAQLRRYITGTDITGFDLDKRVEWWWPDGPRPMAVWWAGTIAFAVAVVVIGQGWLWREPAAPALPPPRPEEVR